MHRGARAVGSIRIAALALTAALAAGGCLATSTPAPASPSVAVPSPAATATATASGAPSSAAPTSPPGTVGPVRIDLRKVAGGFDQPVFATDPGDGSHRLFVVEQSGRIRIVRDGTVEPQPFLDLSGNVSCC